MIFLKILIVSKNDAGQRADKFISKTFPAIPKSMLYKGLRTKNIKLNGKRCAPETKLCHGDSIALYLKDDVLEEAPKSYEFTRAARLSDIVYEDENILLVDKKVGLIVHMDDNYEPDTLIGRIQRYLYEKGEYDPENENSFAPSLINRIDRNTGGIVIAAKNAEALRILNHKMRAREIKKFYLCVVHGKMQKKEQLLTDYLIKNEDKNKVFIYKNPKPSAREIKTKYRVINENKSYSLLEIELLTGRTHQIRAHLASIGHPLLGDGKYGEIVNTKYKKQVLYSYKLIFDFITEAGILDYLNGKEFKVKNIWFSDGFDTII